MTVHELKCWANYFDAVEDGLKTFEVRINDRGYQKGDVLHLHRTRHGSTSSDLILDREKRRSGTYEPLVAEVLYVHPLGTIAPNHVVLAIKIVSGVPLKSDVTAGTRIELPRYDPTRRIGGPEVQWFFEESWKRQQAENKWNRDPEAAVVNDVALLFFDLFDGNCQGCHGEGTLSDDDDCDACQATGERSHEDTVREVLRRISMFGQNPVQSDPRDCICCTSCHCSPCDRSPDDWTCKNRPCECDKTPACSGDQDNPDGTV